MLNAFTIDVEDYFQVGAFANIISPDDWGNWESRVCRNTERFLEILDIHRTKATFFVLGWVAERFPLLVKKIADSQHEIASHGYWHQSVFKQSEAEFREDVRKTRLILQEQSGQPVFAYRAPSFTITQKTPWAHRVLVEEGYTIDSSVFPIRHDIHGNPNAKIEIHEIETPSGAITEFPPSVVRLFGQNVPTGGGGYFRLFPFWLTKRMLRSINAKGRPFTFYIHPWEIDPKQPRIPNAQLKSRLRHYVNLHSTERKIDTLLQSFSFGTISETLSNDPK